jgi:glycine/D-amino acid oxidase-like deaminating enzyme
MTNPDHADRPPGRDDCEVLVIGAGLFGLMTAYHLARLGTDVLLVEREEIGGGASAATSGNLHLQLSPATHSGESDWMAAFARQLPFFRQSIAAWQDLARALPDDIELRITGGIMVAETETQMRALADKGRYERDNGIEVEMLDKAALRRLAPYLAEHFLGAAWCPAEGMANSLTTVCAIARAAIRAGAHVQEHTLVEALSYDDGRWMATTSRGAITASKIVVAAGHASADVAALVGLKLPVTHRPIHVSITEPAVRHIEHLVYHTDLRLTLKQVINGNVLLGGGWSAAIDAVHERPVVLRDSLAKSVWVGQHVVPAIACLNVIRTWAGRNVYTPDSAPIVGAVPGSPGLYLAVCSTYGFTQAAHCGLLAAEAVLGKSSTVALANLSVERFESATAQ